jgi:branched-chain amino acid transport system ATP-binding protein
MTGSKNTAAAGGSGLIVKGLRVLRGEKEVIHGIDLEIAPGRVTALLGPNGAGKSSLVLAIAGALPGLVGQVILDGRPINGLRAEIVRQLGVAAEPEGHRVLTELTVQENLLVAGNHLDRRALGEAVQTALGTFPELREKLGQRAGDLSGGQQQMVVLAQAIIGRPRYLLADELSFGLAPVIVARLVPVITQLAAQGIGVLLIEQFTTIALQISHHCYVMERGRLSFSGSPEQLRQDPTILHSAYLSGSEGAAA